MAAGPRTRRMFSVTTELVTKSREAALAAVQIFNSPLLTFKSEIFIVLMNIAWTYLLHAHYRKNGTEYRYFKEKNNRRTYDKTKLGAYKYWELERCINDSQSPLDRDAANNLRFLIGIRHEIEHQMTSRIDSRLSAKFQACCLNFNDYVKKLFGEKYGIDKHLALSLQFSSINQDQIAALSAADQMPAHIQAYMQGFEKQLTDEEFNSPRFAYRVLFVAKTANRKGQADQVIEFVKADSQLAEGVNRTYAVIKETERPKHLPKSIVGQMQSEGYKRFNVTKHTELWKGIDAKKPDAGFGVQVQNSWYWYDSWMEHVRQHCTQNATDYQ
jgi:hypothetical protein